MQGRAPRARSLHVSGSPIGSGTEQRIGGSAPVRGQRGDMSDAWFDLCCSMLEDVRTDVGKLRQEIASVKEDFAALHDCLTEHCILGPVSLLVQLHRRRFRAAIIRHGFSSTARWEDVLEIKEIILAIGLCGGPSAIRATCGVSRAVRAPGGSVLRNMRELYHGDMYIAGGSRDGVQGGLSSVEVFRSLVGKWEPLPPMRLRREFGSAGIIDGNLYICGGRNGTYPLNTVERFNFARGSWQDMPSMLSARAGASAAVISGKLHVCGGWHGTQFFRSAEQFDPAHMAWQVSPSMLERRGDLAAAAVCGQVYACGGYDGGQVLNSIECLDPALGRWRQARAMWERRMGPAAAAVGGRLFVCGGSSATQAVCSAERYDPRTGVWEALPPMSAGRFCATAAATGGQLYVFGGMYAGHCLNSVERFDPATHTWTAMPPMSERRTGATGAAALI
mmetsp:Transcript_15521/g.42875  ORF Transcript_15521/g.42875 Transcript_15521/m.42875 type:complete len:448 (-) Transcript_15521:49-1392(-)